MALEKTIRLTAALGLAPRESAGHARVPHQLHDVSEERFLNFDSSDLLPGLLQQLRINRTESRTFQIMRIKSVLDVREQLNFFARLRIEHANLHQEAIELRFREGIRALEIHGVLRGKYGEEWREIVARSINRNLAFLHAFQKRGLGARRHAVDFVHQQQVSKNRSLMELKSAVRQVENIGADDVGGHQIGSALHALKIEAQEMRESLNGKCLRNPRHAFQ